MTIPMQGPIIPKQGITQDAVPYVNAFPANSSLPIAPGEIATNTKDGRLWLRKQIDTTRGFSGIYEYNFEQIGGPYVISQKTSGHTLSSEDSGRILEMNVSSSTLLTVPSYTGSNAVPFVKGTEIKVLLTNTGPVNITGASGVTLNSRTGFNITSQWGMATLTKRDVNSWVVTGDLS